MKYMRSLAQAWPDPDFVQQPAAQLPWFHLHLAGQGQGLREQGLVRREGAGARLVATSADDANRNGCLRASR
jgi:hypothetical protein